MDNAVILHIVTVGSILTFKLAALFVGYLIAKLGYELLVKGIGGEFQFKADIKGAKADLASASPGLFFIFMATVLISVAVIKDKPFKTSASTGDISGTEVPQKTVSLPDLPVSK